MLAATTWLMTVEKRAPNRQSGRSHCHHEPRRISLPSKTEKKRKTRAPTFLPCPPPLLTYTSARVLLPGDSLSLSPCLHTLIIMAFFVCHNSNKKKKRWKKKNPFLQRTRHWVETRTTSIVAGSKERASLVCVLCKVENKKVRPNHWRNGKSQVFCVFFSPPSRPECVTEAESSLALGGKSSHQRQSRRRCTHAKLLVVVIINDQRFEVDSHCFPQAF